MLRDLFHVIQPMPEAKWLILGKGPTLDTLPSNDTSSYSTLALNHVARDRKVTWAHIIDLDVLDQLGEKVLDNCDYLLMPYVPHLGHSPCPTLPLSVLAEKHPILSKASHLGKLLAYNLSTSTKRYSDTPVIQARYFSAESATHLLAKLGVTHIRTLGIDGGYSQSASFSDLKNVNADRGYNRQWAGIRKAIQHYKLDYAPLGTNSPIRIFIGCSEKQLVPALVLKHSILRHVTMSCEVTFMSDWTHPMPQARLNQPRTPFSFQRFMIPEACSYKGRAIYMDSDMLVFGDVKEVWQADMGTASILTMRGADVDKHKAQFSHILLDCGRLAWDIDRIVHHLDSGDLSYDDLVFHCSLGDPIQAGHDPAWNSLEAYTKGQTKLLHYTEQYHQPWLRNPAHPLGHLWFSELRRAIEAGTILKELVQDHINRGWILPQCLEDSHASIP